MTDLDTSLTDEELIAEVRKALAQIDETKIPDGTIEQAAKRFVIPLLNDISPKEVREGNGYQEAFDNAVVAMTAERSFSAWLAFRRIRDRELETYIDPDGYLEQLKERTNFTLRQIETTRPAETPNTVVTIKHDGVNRKVNLRKNWVIDR
jgi:hypothetical protein